MIIVADTSPLRYLVLIDAIHILPRMFETVLIPSMVASELSQSSTPAPVRIWIASPPSWLHIATPTTSDPTLDVDPGEYDAILLAIEQHAPLLIDDRKGRLAAE